MIPGTTPTNKFRCKKLNTADIKKLEMVYSQKGEILFEKGTEDVEIVDDHTISVHLTQEETLKFDHEDLVKIQIAILTHSGECRKCRVKRATVEECLKKEVLK